MEYKFSDPQETACIVCSHILLDNHKIEYVTLDDEDGVWQFICGSDEHDETHIKTRPIKHIVEIDDSVNEIADLKKGCTAQKILDTNQWDILDLEE